MDVKPFVKLFTVRSAFWLKFACDRFCKVQTFRPFPITSLRLSSRKHSNTSKHVFSNYVNYPLGHAVARRTQAAFYVGYAEDLRRGFRQLAAYWRTIVVVGALF